jgi:hypothetical protein
MQALNRHVEKTFNLSLKKAHWGRRKPGAGSVKVLPRLRGR